MPARIREFALPIGLLGLVLVACGSPTDQGPQDAAATDVALQPDGVDGDGSSNGCGQQVLGATLLAAKALSPLVDCTILDLATSGAVGVWGCKSQVPPHNLDIVTITAIADGVATPLAATETFAYGSNGPAIWLADDVLQCGWEHCLRIGPTGLKWIAPIGHGQPMNHMDAPGITTGNAVVVPHLAVLAQGLGTGAMSYQSIPAGTPLSGLTAASSLDASTGVVQETWSLPPTLVAAEASGVRTRLRWMWARPFSVGNILFAGEAQPLPTQPDDTCPVIGVAHGPKEWTWFRHLEGEGDCTTGSNHHRTRIAGAALLGEGTGVFLLHRPNAAVAEQLGSLELLCVDLATGATRWRKSLPGPVRTPTLGASPADDDLRAGTLWVGDEGRIFVGRIPHTSSSASGASPTLAMEVLWFDRYGNPLGKWSTDAIAGNLELGAGSLRATKCGMQVIWQGVWHRLDDWGHASAPEAGVCATLTFDDCADTNPCTNDLCDPKLGCTHPNLPDGAACSTNGTCKAGACVEP